MIVKMTSMIKLLLTLYLIINAYLMDKIMFESLLGKHFSYVKDVTRRDFKKNEFEKDGFIINFYSNKNSIEKDFYGMTYNYMTFQTTDKDTIQSVSIHFNKVLNRQFYDSFILKYGEPKSILVIDDREVESETILKDKNGKITQRLRKSKIELKEGSFEDEPLFIIWEKEAFNIKAFIRQKQNISEITFSKN